MDSAKTKQRKVTATHENQLPWELTEEILSRVSPKSLVRFRIVCKRWNSIIDDKKFINNHKETFKFILKSKSKIYSVSIDPKIVVPELTLDIPGLETHKRKILVDCDEFVRCNMDKKAVVWNPWLKSDKRRRHMRNEEQLPRELIEEILSRVSPKSLLRFRIVCKRWKAIMDDKTFISNHKETFRFILSTKSKIYSVSIDPKIVVRELTLDIPGLESQNPKDVIDSDEFLICVMDEGAAVWNPWLKHSVWITHKPGFFFEGICYNGSNRKSDEVRLYKTLWRNNTEWKSHEFPLSAWEDAKFKYNIGVSLNGSLFWVAYRGKTDPMYWLLNFNFSKERKSRFCKLPCRMNHPHDALVLRVFKGDRFSVLKQCHVTKKIEIWVTKNKVNVEDGNDVVWMNFMTLSIPNFPRLIPIIGCRSQQPSYYIDDKRLIVCSCDENGQAWIHVLGENKLISKVQLDSVDGFWPSHCAYFPSLVPVPPRVQKDEAELLV